MNTPHPTEQELQHMTESVMMDLYRRVKVPAHTWELACWTWEFQQVGFAGPYPILKGVLATLKKEGLAEPLSKFNGGGWVATERGHHVAEDLIKPYWRPFKPSHDFPDDGKPRAAYLKMREDGAGAECLSKEIDG